METRLSLLFSWSGLKNRLKGPSIHDLLPDWATERSLYVFAGIELVAVKRKDDVWRIKTVKCNWCGKCCMNLKNHGFPTIDGTCIHLKKQLNNKQDQYLCALGLQRPFGCCIGTGSKVPDCTEEYKEL